MHTQEEWCRIPQSVGDYISHDFYQQLIRGYAEQHPTEQKSVLIAKEFILETLEKFRHVTGIRFMYGQHKGAEPGSRTLLLMACDTGSLDRHLPNIIMRPGGYLTDSGEPLTLDQCWDLMTRYVDRICELMPEQSRKTVPRGVFFGVNIIKHMLAAPGCAGIRFHFGYNVASATPPERYEPVMEAIDKNGHSIHMFGENGQRCPTDCAAFCPSIVENPVGWPFTDSYDRPMTLSDRSLFEMFHYVSPPLLLAVNDKDVYKEHFSECMTLVNTGKVSEAKLELKKQLDHMMEEYLFEQ